MNAIFLQIPKAKASVGCGVRCWQENAATCKIDATATDNSMACTINQPPIDDPFSAGDTCNNGIGVGSKWCGRGACPAGAQGLLTLNGARCDIHDSTVETIWPDCKEPFIVETGKFDASEGQCIGCLEKKEVVIYGTTTGIGNSGGDMRCDSACSAAFECDDELPGFVIPTAPCDGKRKGFCDAGCAYDKVCTTTCGANAECHEKKIGAACTVLGNPGICDNGCVCQPSCDNDNLQEGLEACDGTDLDGQTCATKGFTGGTLACKADCTFDTSGCSACSGAVSDSMCPPGCNLTPGPTYDTDCGKFNCSSGDTIDCDTFASGGMCASFDGDPCGGSDVWHCSGNCDDSTYDNAFASCGVFTDSPQLACGCSCGPAVPPPPACVPSGPENCAAAGDEDCNGSADCNDPACPDGTGCGGGNFCNTGSCVECTTTNLTNCATGEVCTLGSCSPCKGDGDAASGLSQCCAGLNWIDGTCTSRCDPRISFYCNPLRGTVEDVVQGGQKLIGYVLGLVGSIALLFIVIAGMMYMTSAGNEEKIASSKKILTGAVIGIAITLLAYSFLQVIISILNM